MPSRKWLVCLEVLLLRTDNQSITSHLYSCHTNLFGESCCVVEVQNWHLVRAQECREGTAACIVVPRLTFLALWRTSRSSRWTGHAHSPSHPSRSLQGVKAIRIQSTFPNTLVQWFSRSGFHASISITYKSLRNASSWAPPQTHRIRTSGLEPTVCFYTSSPAPHLGAMTLSVESNMVRRENFLVRPPERKSYTILYPDTQWPENG